MWIDRELGKYHINPKNETGVYACHSALGNATSIFYWMKKIVKGLDSMLSIYDIIKGWYDWILSKGEIVDVFIAPIILAMLVGAALFGYVIGRLIICLLSLN